MKPILFNTDMVRAIRDGRKTVTRRMVKPQPTWSMAKAEGEFKFFGYVREKGIEPYLYKPPYCPGDILYVREAFSRSADGYAYKADEPDSNGWGWRPSIHMPREAARIFLRVTDVRIEQLYAITGKQARAEGFLTRDAFIRAFLTMYPGCAIKSWVWVIEFEQIRKEDAG